MFIIRITISTQERIMRTIARKLWVPVLMALVAMASASAQYNVQVGQILTCNYTSGTAGIGINFNGAQFFGISNGFGSYLVTQVNPGGGTTSASVTYVPQTIGATSTIQGFGTITTRLSPIASPASGTRAVNPGSNFPANSTMAFVAVGTLNGVDYTSATPVLLVAPNSMSFAPYVNERFRLQAPVVFNDPQGQAAFTMTNLDVTFNN
jgi:hypothetical protein